MLPSLAGSVDEMREAADSLNQAVGPISRMAGRLPGARKLSSGN